jgi:hypothetical protein
VAPGAAVRKIDGPPAVRAADPGPHASLVCARTCPAVVDRGKRKGQHGREDERRRETRPA